MDELPKTAEQVIRKLRVVLHPPRGPASSFTETKTKTKPSRKLSSSSSKSKRGEEYSKVKARSTPSKPSKLSTSSPASKTQKTRASKSKAKRPDFEGLVDHFSQPDPILEPALTAISGAAEKRKRGRPRKDEEPDLPAPQKWSATAYIDVEKSPVTVRKTPRCKARTELPEPLRLGPVTITHKTTWDSLLSDISRLLHVDKENIHNSLTSLSWKALPETGAKPRSELDMWLPMTNADGYHDFVETGIKKNRSSRFMFRMSPPNLGLSAPV